MPIRKLNSFEQYEEVISMEKERHVVVVYCASFCRGCKMMNPKLLRLTKELSDVEFVKVDTMELEDVASNAGVPSLPYFTVHHSGKEVGNFTGSKWNKIDHFIRSFHA